MEPPIRTVADSISIALSTLLLWLSGVSRRHPRTLAECLRHRSDRRSRTSFSAVSVLGLSVSSAPRPHSLAERRRSLRAAPWHRCRRFRSVIRTMFSPSSSLRAHVLGLFVIISRCSTRQPKPFGSSSSSFSAPTSRGGFVAGWRPHRAQPRRWHARRSDHADSLSPSSACSIPAGTPVDRMRFTSTSRGSRRSVSTSYSTPLPALACRPASSSGARPERRRRHRGAARARESSGRVPVQRFVSEYAGEPLIGVLFQASA